MVGGGIFAVLGLSVQITKGAAPLAFLLSKSFPSRGGTVTFINRAFGPGLFSGGINVLPRLSYIVMLALYCQAFGGYAASFLPQDSRSLGRHVFLTAAIVLITGLNVAGAASTVARSERVVVATKLAILVLFVAIGMAGVSAARLAPAQWSSPVSVIAGGNHLLGLRRIRTHRQRRRGRHRSRPHPHPGLLHLGAVRALRARRGRAGGIAAGGEPGPGPRLRAGRGRPTCARGCGIHDDRHRRDAVDRVGHQRHSLWVSSHDLHDRQVQGAARPA